MSSFPLPLAPLLPRSSRRTENTESARAPTFLPARERARFPPRFHVSPIVEPLTLLSRQEFISYKRETSLPFVEEKCKKRKKKKERKGSVKPTLDVVVNEGGRNLIVENFFISLSRSRYNRVSNIFQASTVGFFFFIKEYFQNALFHHVTTMNQSK